MSCPLLTNDMTKNKKAQQLAWVQAYQTHVANGAKSFQGEVGSNDSRLTPCGNEWAERHEKLKQTVLAKQGLIGDGR